MTGQTLSHYQIQEKLGEGGMGVVYKALDTHLNRSVALKLLPADKVSNPERRKRFVQEARAASALNHPHIVTIYDIASDDGHDFIAMEFVQGKTLDHLLHRKGLQLADTLKYSIQIADALAKAHSAGIVHRDLKPSNVMVTEDGRVKVLDFGLAKLVEPDQPDADASTRTLQEGAPKTDEGAIVGTVAYMSPEQAEGKKLDGRSDIFSFGSVLYEMSTGQRAFQGETKLSTLSAILREEPKPASQLARMVPRDLEKVIQRCLRKDPERRFQSMKDVKIALEELKEESDSGELEVTEVRRVHSPIRLWGLGVLIVVAVTAVGIAAWLWLNRSDPTQEQAQLTAVPLTTYRGYERFPSFSPDETQVAFSWCKEDEKCHIYIKQVGVEPPFQLTNTGLDDFGPAWSPDGRFIAFIRKVGPKKVDVILIPQRGGSERQLASWDLSKMSYPPDYPPFVAWTPDSQWVAFPYTEGDQPLSAILLMSVNTGEKRWLTTVPPESLGDTAPAFSPDGGTMAFIRQSRQREDDSDLYLLHLREGYWPQAEPERVMTGNPVNRGPVWIPNGRELLIDSGTFMDTKICRLRVSNPGKPVRLGLTSDNAWGPSISRTGKRLAYAVWKFDLNIWRVDLGGPGGTPGSPVELISSTKYEFGPAYSADGKRIAFISERTGAWEVWTCDGEGRNAMQLTSFGFESIQGPKWSPDGQNIVFSGIVQGSQQVYVVSASGGAPRRLTKQPGSNHWPFWSYDGSWIYFKNSPGGRPDAWKVPPQGGEETRVTHSKEGVDTPQESADGKFLYFGRGWPFTLSIWRVSIESGEEMKVLDSVHPQSRWTARQEGIYYLSAPDENGASDLCLLEFGSGKVRKLLRAPRKMFLGDIAISPDGRMVLYSQADEAGGDLMLVENFR